MKRLLDLLTPLLGALLLILSAPTVMARLKVIYPDAELHITIFLIICTFIIFYFNSYTPLLKYEKLKGKRWVLLKQTAEIFFKDYEEHAFELNIMVPERSYFYSIEPTKSDKSKKKFTVIGKVFRVEWEPNKLNARFKMSINQGLAGDVYKQGNKIIFNDNPINDIFNFNNEQKQMLIDLKLIISCPLNIEVKGQMKTVGVFNLHSKKDKALEVLQNEEWIKLDAKLRSFSKMCVNIL